MRQAKCPQDNKPLIVLDILRILNNLLDLYEFINLHLIITAKNGFTLSSYKFNSIKILYVY